MTGWSTRCYMLDPVGSNSMKSRNPNSGFHEIGVWPCLDTSSQNPVKGQGGGVVVCSHLTATSRRSDRWTTTSGPEETDSESAMAR